MKNYESGVVIVGTNNDWQLRWNSTWHKCVWWC